MIDELSIQCCHIIPVSSFHAPHLTWTGTSLWVLPFLAIISTLSLVYLVQILRFDFTAIQRRPDLTDKSQPNRWRIISLINASPPSREFRWAAKKLPRTILILIENFSRMLFIVPCHSSFISFFFFFLFYPSRFLGWIISEKVAFALPLHCVLF